jgi:hypothetical protein
MPDNVSRPDRTRIEFLYRSDVPSEPPVARLFAAYRGLAQPPGLGAVLAKPLDEIPRYGVRADERRSGPDAMERWTRCSYPWMTLISVPTVQCASMGWRSVASRLIT